MSSNLMDTEPGGRNTQYESIKTVTNPTAKEPGQLGHGSSSTTTTADAPSSGSTHHHKTTANAATQVSPAEKIRFGQAVSEQGGVTGYTDPAMAGTGRAAHAGGFGGTEALVEGGEGGGSDEAQRRAQGYGGKADMDGGVGA